jgi:transposase
VAESLGISDGTLVAWTAEFDKADAPGALNADERAELVRLRKELVEVKQEREILKKSAAYFAKETFR